MSLLPPALLDQVRRVATEFPSSAVDALANRLEQSALDPGGENWEARLLVGLPNPALRHRLAELIRCWRADAPALNGQSLAAALLAVSYCHRAYQRENSVELVWTGPDSGGMATRRTEQALTQVIEAATGQLVVVSFAIYNVPEIEVALSQALDRGVNVKLVVETPESGQGKLSFGAHNALAPQLLQRIHVYIWPQRNRPKDERGRYGSLHAKCAIADDSLLYISSANLTGYALNLNMEMGLLIRNKAVVQQAKCHFETLIDNGVLVQNTGN